MKIFAISDLHLSVQNEKPMDIFGASWENYMDEIKSDWKKKVSPDDIVLLCGDLCWAMKLDELPEVFKEFDGLDGEKFLIRGNHDYWWKGISSVRAVLPASFHALQNDAIKIGNVVFCGTRGWTVAEKNATEDDEKIYKREVLRMELSLKVAQKLQNDGDKIVVLIHYPPFDSSRHDNELTNLFEEYGVSAVVYGHLHGKNSKAQKLIIKNDIPYYLTSCDQVENNLVEIKFFDELVGGV